MLRLPAITIFFVVSLLGQSNIYFSPSFDPELARAGMETISRTDLEAHLSFLASDITEGRATGERGLAIAGEYIASQFRRLGLTPLVNNNSFCRTKHINCNIFKFYTQIFANYLTSC